jgi:acetyltransferase-like isoleucine patch superfamily enzyme
MGISSALEHILKLLYVGKRGAQSNITIPYGKHSYGPQPEIVGFLQKARGSRVGNFCSIAPGLKFIFLGKHKYNWVSAYPFYEFYDKWKTDIPLYHRGVLDVGGIPPNPITIENDVWIASNVTVKEGVRIGNGAVAAMGSLVTKDVPPYAMVGGNPARIIKYRFSKVQVDELLRIAWWDWEDKDIMKVVPLLLSDDVDAFIEAAKNKPT